MPTYTITLENLNKPIPIKTTILYCHNLHLAQLPKTPVTSVAGHSTCESIGNLTNLKELYCYDNQLQALPKTPVTSVAGHSTCECIWNLINLQKINCSYNQLQALPESIGNLDNLQILFCYNNPFTKEINDIISKYPHFGNKAQKILQELRDAYLIPIDNSYVLK
jgi:Leucine-rich repeat (LRR) protein